MKKNTTIALTNYSILTCELNDMEFNSQCIINTVNQYSYIIAEKDKEFKLALQQSDVLLPDGIGIIAAVKLLTGSLIKKIAGEDVHYHLLEQLNEKGGRCFYLGSTDETLNLIKKKIAIQFPRIEIATLSPPFKQFFSMEEDNMIIAAINAFKPDLLFVGMTAPKQEKWTHKYRSQLNAKTICSIGAVFDFYAGTIKRPSKFWQNLWLEWFVRLLKEPRRMFKRYLVYGPLFVLKIFKHRVKKVTTQQFFILSDDKTNVASRGHSFYEQIENEAVR